MLPRLEPALSLIFPELCQVCGDERASRAEGYVCQECRLGRDGLHYIVEPYCRRCGLPFQGAITTAFQCSNCKDLHLRFDYARAAVRSQGIVRDAIHRYKYSQHRWFEPFLAELLIEVAGPVLRTESWDFIVPVPLHPDKEREREFNQAERLAEHLANALSIPLNTSLLIRSRTTQVQASLNRDARIQNVRRAFAPHPRAGNLKGRSIILVDDILTTGSTASACAGQLKRQGASRVCVWTVARQLLEAPR